MINSKQLAIAIGASLVAIAAAAAPAEPAAEREVFVEQGQRKAGTESITGNASAPALERTGPRLGKASSAKNAARLASANQDFWIFDAYADVFFDEDLDGYYTRLEVEFDADTVYSSADVYAVLFLSLEGGPWNELTTTAIFEINGATGDDVYFVDTDLISGYPTGSYDVLIELYDAFDGAFVASIGPEDTTALFDLPLEDQIADQPGGGVVVVTEGGGGSAGFGAFGLLALALLARRRAGNRPL